MKRMRDDLRLTAFMAEIGRLDVADVTKKKESKRRNGWS